MFQVSGFEFQVIVGAGIFLPQSSQSFFAKLAEKSYKAL
jgi:hypothetical protein